MNSKRPATRVGRHFFKSQYQIKMEKYTINYSNRNTDYTAEVYAESEDQAVEEVKQAIPGYRNSFRILEIIPEGVVSGFEVQLVGSKILHL